MREPDVARDIVFSPAHLIPLSWEHEHLLPESEPGASSAQAAEITLLHTNDLHSSVDGRQDSDGKHRGGLARIATTIRRARAVGPTLVFDVGDAVFGAGTWWDLLGAGAVARLRGAAGCDLATVGNHDLEHGMTGLRELLAGGYPFVSANLGVDDPYVQHSLYPAYLIEIGGWRIGVTGLTTLSTLELVPGRLLQGITLSDPRQALIEVVTALEPLVDTIVVLSHLGYYPNGTGDADLAMQVAGSKVSVILGGHTHDALEPAQIVAGIAICHPGAFGAQVGEVKLRREGQGPVEVHTRLLAQDATIPDDPVWTGARAQEAQAFQRLHETQLPVPTLPLTTGSALLNREREWTLLARALRASGTVSPGTVLMVPLLYVLGSLPARDHATLAEIMTAYPNREYLVEAEIDGQALKHLLALQASLLSYQQARPFWVRDETEVQMEQVEDKEVYHMVTSELVCEGGLGWGLARSAMRSRRSLNVTCLQIVQDYLRS